MDLNCSGVPVNKWTFFVFLQNYKSYFFVDVAFLYFVKKCNFHNFMDIVFLYFSKNTNSTLCILFAFVLVKKYNLYFFVKKYKNKTK